MIKSFVFFCFLSTWSLFWGQSYKIIIINNGDTTVISSDPNSMDSLIELNMKSMYGIGTDMERVFKDVQVEVFIDSILNQSVLVLEEPADTVRFKVGNKRIVVIEKWHGTHG
ncbi:MAG: hypothetical protein ACKO7O_00955 [Bacteroidota bacterium]